MRTCGDCRSCCVDLPIMAFGKPSGVPCSNSGADGCAIYANRPPLCKNFYCLWLEEHPFTEESWRPDVCGFLLWRGSVEGVETIIFKPVRQDANHSKEGRKAILRFARIYPKTFKVLR